MLLDLSLKDGAIAGSMVGLLKLPNTLGRETEVPGTKQV
jgi:hypothetical protein